MAFLHPLCSYYNTHSLQVWLLPLCHLRSVSPLICLHLDQVQIHTQEEW